MNARTTDASLMARQRHRRKTRGGDSGIDMFRRRLILFDASPPVLIAISKCTFGPFFSRDAPASMSLSNAL